MKGAQLLEPPNSSMNGANTAHKAASFHSRHRFIMAHDNGFTFQVRRGYELHRSPLMHVFEDANDVPEDGTTFVLSKQACLPVALGGSSRMIQHYCECCGVSREVAEIELRSLDAMAQESWTVPNRVVHEYEF